MGLPDSVTDASGTTSWTWNEFDLPATKTRVVDGVSLTMTYGYDEHGQLTSQTYPSGMVVEYVYEMGKVVSVKVNGSTFISGIQYRPFSNEPVSWTWSAGGSRTKTFDAEGMPSGIVDAGLTQAVAFDAAGRVTSLTGPGFSMIPSYSAADQLAGVNVGGQTQTFTFNTNLNRLTKKTFAGPVVATPITSNTNLHSTISDPTPPALSATFAYDARKNMTFNGRTTMSYDLKGNLATAVGGGVSASYAYNAFSQRVKKTVGAVSTHFTYDEAGNLAGEYSSSGVRQAEHIYLGDLPIGAMFGSGPAQPMRVHADYLGTPRAITNGSTVMWKWEPTDPFGANLPSVQAVVYNPRFPGQYHDAETNLHYNHHRTYDPSLGRYVQPDPIGLAGGKNPFNYANQNPLNATDREGLELNELVRAELIHIIENRWVEFHKNPPYFEKPKLVDHVGLNIGGTVYEVNPVGNLKLFNREGRAPIIGWNLLASGVSRDLFFDKYSHVDNGDIEFRSFTFLVNKK